MVHALAEVRRVLVSDGILIDIRPRNDRWPVEVASANHTQATGRLDDLPDPLQADAASDRAMQEVESRGWFGREQQELFSFFYSWDTPSEMEESVAEEWSDFVELGEETKQATRSAWAIAEADARVRVRVKISIAKWRAKGADRSSYQKSTASPDRSAPGPSAQSED